MRHLFLSIFISTASWHVHDAALRTCSTAEAGLPNGLWTEWETTEACSTDCGSCSKRFSTRKCLSSSIGKACTGNSTRQILCNTQVCAYPAQRACCVPYVPMLIDGKTQCGPIPKDISSTGTSCCPSAGLVSEWSAFYFDTDAKLFTRTRKCVSDQMGCSCGSTVMTDTRVHCPCKDFEDVSATVKQAHRVFANSMNTFVVDNNQTCYGYHLLETEYINSVSRPCNEITNHGEKFQASLIRYLTVTQDGSRNNTPIEFRVYDCDAKDSKKNKITFYCDLQSTHWRLDGTNEEVIGWNQVNILSS